MQPYFLPYIGYFQLIAAVDQFILYDNIKYTKKGWINRNRMLQNGKEVMFSLPLKSDSDSLDVCKRELSVNFNRNKLLNQFKGAYRHAPYFEQTLPLIEEIVHHQNANLFQFLQHSIVKTCKHLDITTEIRNSSCIAIDHTLKSQGKVIALCQAMGASTYVNAIGGMELYSKEMFQTQDIELKFIKPRLFAYPQFGKPFVPWLSMLDVMMFNTLHDVREHVHSGYALL
ncbi:MAG: WbqC family protein [Rhodoferax sp.]